MQKFNFKEEAGKINIEGEINEWSNFDEIFTNRESPLVINMRGVQRINSSGIKSWIESLNHFPKLEIELEECPESVVLQCNVITNFMGKDQVRIKSFYAYYYCDNDDSEKMVLFKEGEHYEWGQGITRRPEVSCGLCDSAMELDDDPESYFLFLSSPQNR